MCIRRDATGASKNWYNVEHMLTLWCSFKFHILWFALALFLAACSAAGRQEAVSGASEEGATMAIQISSLAFEDGAAIPKIYSCDGDDISPPLSWENVPAGTESLALIVDDPDAPVGTWVHWVAYDIPPESAGLPEDVPTAGDLPGGGTQGNNSWKRSGYGGPCPPGGTHRYFFKLYALDTVLGLAEGTTKDQLLQAMEGHVLDEGQLMGTYSR